MENKTITFLIYSILVFVFFVCIIWLDNQNISLFFTNLTLAIIISLLALISFLLFKANENSKLFILNNKKTLEINKNLKKRIKKNIKELSSKDEKINYQFKNKK